MTPTTVTIVLPGPLRRIAGAGEVAVEGHSVAAALAALVQAHPGLAGRITDAEHALRPFVRVFVDGQIADVDTQLRSGAEVTIAPALSGG